MGVGVGGLVLEALGFWSEEGCCLCMMLTLALFFRMVWYEYACTHCSHNWPSYSAPLIPQKEGRA